MTDADAANHKTERSIRKFNPGTFQSDEEVIEQFVVREGELAIVLDVLRGNIDSPSCQHVLIVAPRGRGKTMLLARVGAALRTVDALSRFLLPVRFTEESHEIFNLADFWLDALFHLGRECAAHDPPLARDLRTTHDALSSRWQDEMLEEHARAAVLAAADRLGRKLVLMVENMQALHQNVDADFGWKLRQVLQSEPQIMLLSSATSRFKGLDDATQPFFELFRIVDLEPLATAECRRLWHAVSGEAVTGREVRPLEILTGGSPRLLVIVAGFARHRSLRQLMEELVTLVDEHTEYFRNHLEVLSKVERRVYLAAIDLWQPSKPSEIAARARMDVRVVSTMLGRLLNRGTVIAEGGGKKRLYSAAERLYSIYYKLRRDRDEAAVVRNLIHFMVAFYTEAQLFELSERLTLEAKESAVIREGLDQALAELPPVEDSQPSAVRVFRQVSTQAIESYHREVQQQIDSALRNENFETVVEIVDLSLGPPQIGSPRLPAPLIADMLHQRASAYRHLGEREAAIAGYDEVVVRFGNATDSYIQWRVATALGDKGDVCTEVGNLEAAIAAYDEVVARFGNAGDPDIQWRVAAALDDKGDACAELGKPDAAIHAYNEVVARFGTSDDSEIQWRVAYALIHKGDSCGRLNHWEAATAAYDEAITRFGTSDDAFLRSWVASALLGKGDACRERGNHGAAVSAYSELVRRFGNSDDSSLQWRVAEALVGKGQTLAELGDREAAIATYNELIARFGDSEDTHIRWRIAVALGDKGDACVALGDPRAGVLAYKEVIGRFGDSDDSSLQGEVASALLNCGQAYKMLGDHTAAIAACDEVVNRFGESDRLRLQWRVAAALVNKGRMREELRDRQAAIAAYEQLISRYGHSRDPGLQLWIALAIAGKGMRQADLGLADGALRSSDEIERRLGTLLTGDGEIKFRWRALCVRTRALLIRGEH